MNPLPPQLDDAPPMIFGYCFLCLHEWWRFAKLGSLKREMALTRAFWRIELYLRAQNQNWRSN